MFDIDGTLVDTAGLDGDLYAAAVRSVLGVEVDPTWASYTHVTDSGVLDEVLRGGDYGARAAELRAEVASRFVAATRAHLAGHERAIREINGAVRLIERLGQEPGVRVAIATGGWYETATLKLRYVGIDPKRLALATGSDAVARTAIMRLAELRASGDEVFRRVTYFGDSPWDQRASTALGYDFVAVGRGVEQAIRFDDLTDYAAIAAHLGI